VIKAYKNACTHEPLVLLQAVFSYASDDEKALEAAREWKGTMVDEHYTDPIYDPAEISKNGEEKVPDAMFTKQVICSSDPATHVKCIKLVEKLGADIMVLMNVSGADPHAALRVYGEKVLPELRSG
jgi:alkanesulfonate monooxygenase SsuD/methylene tetrahydromethanopterin reductase-like flavin-dependent oxidoreductase (luciferase family)